MFHRRPAPSVRNSPNLPTTCPPSKRVIAAISKITPPPTATVLIVIPDRQINQIATPARNKHRDARELDRSNEARQKARAAIHKQDDQARLRNSEADRPRAMIAPSPISAPV